MKYITKIKFHVTVIRNTKISSFATFQQPYLRLSLGYWKFWMPIQTKKKNKYHPYLKATEN